MFNQRDMLVEAERRHDEMSRAQKERLVRSVMMHNAPSANGYQRWLARLGARMESWGYRLQARYDEPLSFPGAVQQERC